MAVVVIHTEVLSPHPCKKIIFKLHNLLNNITAYVRYGINGLLRTCIVFIPVTLGW
jgi:hypothetical protein